MTDSGNAPRLLVDAVPPAPSRFWSTVGAALLVLLSLATLLLDQFFLWGIVLALLLAVLGARFSRKIVPPRRHPLNSPLLPLAAVLLLLLRVQPLPLFAGLLLLFAALHAGLWLVRTERALSIASWGVLTAAALGGPLAWSALEREIGPEYMALIHPADPLELGLILLVMLVGFFPWLLTLRAPRRVSAFSLLVLILAGFAAPTVHTSLRFASGELTLSTLFFGGTALLVAMATIAGGMTVRRVIAERRRWPNPAGLRGLFTGSAPLALLLVLILFLPAGLVTLRVWAFLGLSFAVTLAAREIRLVADETRHPASRPLLWWAPFEEAWIILRSLVASAVAAMQKRRFSTLNTPRRILSAEGDIYMPFSEGTPNWAPLVMHMHSNRWEGAFTAEQVVDHYATLGARSVVLTDHNRITRPKHNHAGPPAYEHGWGPHNHHTLVLGARKTIAERHAFGGKFGSRIETLQRLREVGEFLVLAHPGSSNAWPSEEITGLDYGAIELFNKSWDSTAPWDEALTSGLLVWGTAGDDNHDLRSRHQTGKRFLMLNAEASELKEGQPLSPSRALELMQKGAFITCCLAEPPENRRITRALPEPDMPQIVSFTHKNGGLEVHFAEPVELLRVIGPDGVVLSETRGETSALVIPPDGASYARLEARHGDWQIALNPVVRILKGAAIPWS